MVLWIFVIYDARIFCYVIYLTLLWANEPIQGLACHIEATVFSEPGCYTRSPKERRRVAAKQPHLVAVRPPGRAALWCGPLGHPPTLPLLLYIPPRKKP